MGSKREGRQSGWKRKRQSSGRQAGRENTSHVVGVGSLGEGSGM